MGSRIPRIYNRLDNNPTRQPWYAIRNNAGTDQSGLEVMIYDDIGSWGVRAADFVREVKAADDGKSPIKVRINSDGGDVFDGIAISNFLNRLGERCVAYIDGLAASAASIIACGAYRVVIAANAQMMIHNPWTIAAGDADELRRTADVLDQVGKSLIATYQGKTNKLDADQLKNMLDRETWLSAGEALSAGLADEIGSVATFAARQMSPILAKYRNVPKALLVDNTPAPPAPAQTGPAVDSVLSVVECCNKLGLPNLVKDLLAKANHTDAGIKAEQQRLVAIRELCMVAKQPALTETLYRQGLDEQAVRARLLNSQADQDLPINNQLSDSPPKASAFPTPMDVYGRRRQHREKQ